MRACVTVCAWLPARVCVGRREYVEIYESACMNVYEGLRALNPTTVQVLTTCCPCVDCVYAPVYACLHIPMQVCEPRYLYLCCLPLKDLVNKVKSENVSACHSPSSPVHLRCAEVSRAFDPFRVFE